MRIRQQGLYKAFFTNSYKTIRFTEAAPITPELEDVAINSKCYANCHYCYTSALKTGDNFDNILEKAEEVWGSLKPADRPFQIAIGGAGEPTLHPDFIPFLQKVRELGIIPNYTTNGMHLSNEILEATQKWCGGVALSYHPHLKTFDKSLIDLSKLKIKLNVHVIIGSEQSLIDLKEIYQKYYNHIDYFVILPYQAVGRGTFIDTQKVWEDCFLWINSVDSKKFAFGALFWEWLQSNNIPLKMSLYNPDIYSGYRLLNNSYKTLYKSSYELVEKNTIYV